MFFLSRLLCGTSYDAIKTNTRFFNLTLGNLSGKFNERQIHNRKYKIKRNELETAPSQFEKLRVGVNNINTTYRKGKVCKTLDG